MPAVEEDGDGAGGERVVEVGARRRVAGGLEAEAGLLEQRERWHRVDGTGQPAHGRREGSRPSAAARRTPSKGGARSRRSRRSRWRSSGPKQRPPAAMIWSASDAAEAGVPLIACTRGCPRQRGLVAASMASSRGVTVRPPCVARRCAPPPPARARRPAVASRGCSHPPAPCSAAAFARSAAAAASSRSLCRLATVAATFASAARSAATSAVSSSICPRSRVRTAHRNTLNTDGSAARAALSRASS